MPKPKRQRRKEMTALQRRQRIEDLEAIIYGSKYDEKVYEKASAELDRLYDEDMEERYETTDYLVDDYFDRHCIGVTW